MNKKVQRMKFSVFLCAMLIHAGWCALQAGVSFADVIRIPAVNMTQSQAQMSIPALKKEVEEWYHPQENKFIAELWGKVVAREAEFNDTHYVFYTAFNNEWRLLQDLYLKLYERFHPLTLKIKDFRTFRWVPVHETLKEFLQQEFLTRGLIDDNDAHVKARVISTNFALFGNVGFMGECTMQYFLARKSNTQLDVSYYKTVLDRFGCSHKYVPVLQNLEQYLLGSTINVIILKDLIEIYPQTLSQIFVPKEIVDDVAYVSWVEGIPYEPEFVAWIMEKPQNEIARDKDFTFVWDKLKRVRKLFQEKKDHPIFKLFLDGISNNKYRVSALLEQYKSKPQSLPYLNNIQARLFMDAAGILSKVGAHIKVFDYDTIPAENKIAYEKRIDELAERIFRDRLDELAPLNVSSGGLVGNKNNAVDIFGQALGSISSAKLSK